MSYFRSMSMQYLLDRVSSSPDIMVEVGWATVSVDWWRHCWHVQVAFRDRLALIRVLLRAYAFRVKLWVVIAVGGS